MAGVCLRRSSQLGLNQWRLQLLDDQHIRQWYCRLKASRSAKTDFALDALEQALHARRPAYKAGLIHHSERGGQYLSIRYTERLAKAGIEPSVGSVGDAYDRASGRQWFKTTGEGLGRDYQRPLQNRSHPAAQLVENFGRGRTGNPQLVQMVQ